MDLCALQDASPLKACHNCRRSRRRCDRSIPSCSKCLSTGQVCLGYGKFLNWTNSVASRGKLMGKSFAVTKVSGSHPSVLRNSGNKLAASLKRPQSLEHENSLTLEPVSTWYRRLDDPLFQDLSQDVRFYLSYCKSFPLLAKGMDRSPSLDDVQVCKDLVLHDLPNKNPFRDLLTLSNDHEVLQHIIVANSALHLANTTTSGHLTRSKQQAYSSKPYKDALVAKHKALMLLSEALAHKDFADSDIILASIMLFIKFELLDSGTNEWRFHIDGARQLMVYLCQNGKPGLSGLDSLRNCLITNCAM